MSKVDGWSLEQRFQLSNPHLSGRFAALPRHSEMSLAQFDFAILAVQFVSSEAEANFIPMGEPSAALESAGNVENCVMEVDAPAQHDDVGTKPSLSQNMLEPTRSLHSDAPPRRFHRTIWRSMAIRILALSYVDENGRLLKQRLIQGSREPCAWNAGANQAVPK